MPGAFVDFGLYFFHNANALIAKGAGPYFYLPKLESHLEARLWNDVFTFAQERLEIPYGTIRATCLIETTPAAFEMEEILYELRDHSAGLNAGRWDYIFSMIKNFAEDADHVLPDRSQVTMTSPFMAAYANLLVRTCHARGAHAIGGMAAFVPSRSNPEATAAALEKTTADKSPGGRARFRRLLGRAPGARRRPAWTRSRRCSATGPTSSSSQRPGRDRDAATSCSTSRPPAARSRWRACGPTSGSAWSTSPPGSGGAGAVAIDNLMEDAATVEISRMQVWHWVRHHARTADGHRGDRGPGAPDPRRGGRRPSPRAPTRRLSAGSPPRSRSSRHTCLVTDWPQFFTGYAYEHYLVAARCA